MNPTRRSLRVDAGWCVSFRRPFPKNFQYRRLRFAYRAPSFFLSEMSKGGHQVGYLGFDEALTLRFSGEEEELGGRQASDFVWITTHGEFTDGGYQFDLHSEDISFGDAYIGRCGGPSVLILDTCDAIDTCRPNWRQRWAESAGPNLRIVLGFSTPATVSEVTSVRGRAFARRLLAGDSIVDAWVDSATNTTYPGTDHAIAFAIGDSRDDAITLLREATLSSLPPPRTGSSPVIVDIAESE